MQGNCRHSRVVRLLSFAAAVPASVLTLKCQMLMVISVLLGVAAADWGLCS